MSNELEDLLPAGLSISSFLEITDQFARLSSKDLALRLSDFTPEIRNFIVNQFSGRETAAIKFPSIANSNLVYPTKKNLEQCSSQWTAAYKSEIRKGELAIDLTTGFGIDVIWLSKVFNSVIAVEPNPELHRLQQFNFNQLGIHNVTCVNQTAESFLKDFKGKADLIYADPSRRIANQRISDFNLFEPNPQKIVATSRKLTRQVMLKMSPMNDLSELIRHFPETVTIHVLSLSDECREVLLTIKPNNVFDGTTTAVELSDAKSYTYTFNIFNEKTIDVTTSEIASYLYLPGVSVTKAGSFRSICYDFRLNPISLNTHLFTHNIYHADFPGRVFEVLSTHAYQAKELRKSHTDKGFILMKRNFPDSIEQIKRKLRVTDFGSKYLFAYRNQHDKPEIAICELVR